jgi:ribosome-associated protein
LTSRNLAKKIAGFAFSKKASDVQLLDLRKVSDVADFFVLCSADSDVQVKAIADAVLDGLAESDIHPWHREGVSQKQWILLDFIDVVVHVFHKDARKFYGLEKLWGDAKIEVVADEPAAQRKKAAAPGKPAAGRSAPATKSPAGTKAPAAAKAPTARKSPSAGRSPAARKSPKK